jgi:DNA (cytosine-5)-methyltransferase 1
VTGPRVEAGPVIGSLCTGIGGLDLAVLSVLGGRLGWVADPDRHIRTVLTARTPGVVNHGDIAALDWAAVDPAEVLTAGFPCQDISSAGHGAGIEKGARSGLWRHVITAVRVLRPRLVFVENVAAIRFANRGMHVVLRDLATAGYDACWRSVRAADIGAAHRRERVFFLAWPADERPAVATDSPGQPRARRDRPQASRRSGSPGPTGRRPLRDRPAPADPNGGRLSLLVVPGEPAASAARQPDPHRGDPHLRRAVRADGTVAVPASPLIGLAGPDRRPRHNRSVNWGEYRAAVRRWERLTGRPAPCPTQTGRTGRPVPTGRFVEWLMGYPDGWVTDLDLPRTAQLHALGNAVVPAQAVQALTLLLADRARDPRASAAGVCVR